MTTAESGSSSSVRLAHLVVGVDGSPESLYALDLAASIGGPHGATLTIVHVHTQSPVLSFSPAAAIEFERAEAEVGAGLLTEAQRRLAGYAGKWSVTTRRGHVSNELLAVADESNADMIVVGHRSHGPIRDAILGSVAAGTVHRSRRSVIVAIRPR